MTTSLLLIALALCQPLVNAATIILVRHAERAGGTDASVPLSERGQQRAQYLAHMLSGSGVQAIYTTDVVRTQQTAAPLAKQLKLEPVSLPGRDVDGLVARLRSLDSEQVVLVVGHSNTVPEIVMKLGAVTPPISDTEFDRMVILHTHPQGKPTVLSLHYGE